MILAAAQQAAAPKPPTARARAGAFIWSAFGLLSQRHPEAWQSTMPPGFGSADAMAALWAQEGDRAQALALPSGCERAFRKGAAPLHVACYLGRKDSVVALLQAGTPLLYCASFFCTSSLLRVCSFADLACCRGWVLSCPCAGSALSSLSKHSTA